MMACGLGMVLNGIRLAWLGRVNGVLGMAGRTHGWL